jgi:cytochrome c-type biogenesis protein CcmH/NrfG
MGAPPRKASTFCPFSRLCGSNVAWNWTNAKRKQPVTSYLASRERIHELCHLHLADDLAGEPRGLLSTNYFPRLADRDRSCIYSRDEPDRIYIAEKLPIPSGRLVLGPVIGIIQINQQAHADRYTYLPQIGLYLLIVWSIADWAAASRFRRQLASTAAIIAIICFMWVACVQATYWCDSETLWRHTIAVTKQNHFAHASLADLLLRQGRVHEAISHCEEALRIQPEDADAQNNLGLAFLQIGDERDAVVHLSKCLEIDPRHMNAAANLAWLLATSPDASTRDGTRAVELAEDVARRAGTPNVIVLPTLAAAYAETGRFSEAIDVAQNALQLARAQQNEALAKNLAFNIASYRVHQPLRDETRRSTDR